MKKRMQTLMFLTLAVFLFSGLASVKAQTTSLSPAVTILPGKVEVNYMTSTDAIDANRVEMSTNFDVLNPPVPDSPATAYTFYRLEYHIMVQGYIVAGHSVGESIVRAFNDAKEMSKADWPNLVDEAWYTDLVTLLSI